LIVVHFKNEHHMVRGAIVVMIVW